MRNHYFIFIALTLCLFCSCQKKSTEHLLSEAENIITTRLDSANNILDKISHPEQLTGIQQAEYCRMKAICASNITMEWAFWLIFLTILH